MGTRLRSLADAVRAADQRTQPDLRPRVEPLAPDHGPAVGVDEITVARLLISREVASARARAQAFADFLRINTQRLGVPLDESLPHIEYWHAFVESFGVAYLHWPDAFPEPTLAEDESLAEEWNYAPLSDDEAWANGLAVAACREKRIRIAPTLAGCQGKMSDGSDCVKLRRKGERYCPSHRAAAIRHLRRIPA